jgi:hypothetical protein
MVQVSSKSSPAVPKGRRVVVGSVLALLALATVGLAAWSVVGVLLQAPPTFTAHTVIPFSLTRLGRGGYTPLWWVDPRTIPRTVVTVHQSSAGLLGMGVVISRSIQIAITVLTLTAMILGLVPKPQSMRKALPVHERWLP